MKMENIKNYYVFLFITNKI